MSGMGRRERTGVNCVTGEGGFQHGSDQTKFEPSALALKRFFWDINGVAVVKEG